MFKSRFGRVIASGALAGAGVLAMAAPSSASPATFVGIKCKSMVGNIATTVTMKKCNGNTGGASKAMAATSLASGGTIQWVNGKSTTVKLTVAQGNSALCPSGSTEYNATGKTTADTTGSAPVGGKVKAQVCVSGTGAITLVPGTVAKIG